MFKCHRCGKVLVSKQAFTYHMNRKKPCIITHDCDTCSSSFRTKFDLSIHKLRCTKEHLSDETSKIVVEMDGFKVSRVKHGNEYIDFEVVTVC